MSAAESSFPDVVVNHCPGSGSFVSYPGNAYVNLPYDTGALLAERGHVSMDELYDLVLQDQSIDAPRDSEEILRALGSLSSRRPITANLLGPDDGAYYLELELPPHTPVRHLR